MTYPPGQNPHGGQSSYGAAGGYGPPPKNSTDTFGVIGLILGVFGVLVECCCLPGAVLGVLLSLAALVLGIVGLQKADREERSAVLSIAAIALGVIGLLAGILALVGFLALNFGGLQDAFAVSPS